MILSFKNNLSIVITALLITTFFNSSLSAQDIKYFDTVEGKVCKTDWIETAKTDSKLLQIRFAYLKKHDTYYVILGRMSLNVAWEDVNTAKLVINDMSYSLESIAQDTRKAGDGVFEVRTFYFSKSYMKKIMGANISKFKITNNQYVVSQKMKNYWKKLSNRVSMLKSSTN